jgi:hypothetical protein
MCILHDIPHHQEVIGHIKGGNNPKLMFNPFLQARSDLAVALSSPRPGQLGEKLRRGFLALPWEETGKVVFPQLQSWGAPLGNF